MDLVSAEGLKCREFQFGDVTDFMDVRRAVDGVEAVVHLGARAGNSRIDPQNVMRTNLMGTYHVLLAAREAGVRKVVFASSECAFGYATSVLPDRTSIPIHYFPIDENHPDHPTDDYGLSKLLGERMCRSCTEAYGIQTDCLRICRIVHPEDYPDRWRHWVSDPDSWDSMWVYLDVRDAAEGFRLALENDTFSHEVFYMTASTSGVAMPTEDLIRRYFSNVPKVDPDLKGDKPLISSEKARRLLGFSPRHTWQSQGVVPYPDDR